MDDLEEKYSCKYVGNKTTMDYEVCYDEITNILKLVYSFNKY